MNCTVGTGAKCIGCMCGFLRNCSFCACMSGGLTSASVFMRGLVLMLAEVTGGSIGAINELTLFL